MNRISRARHRANCRPKTFLSDIDTSKYARRGTIAAVGTSLALAVGAPSASASEDGSYGASVSASVEAPAAQPAAPTPSGTTHTVRAGDTVGKLARQYGSSISAIVEANGLNAQALIIVGETLTIPGASSGGASAGGAVDRGAATASRTAERASVSAAAVPASSSAIVNEALRHVGTPYVWGGSQPGAFDCSGFTSYVYGKFGIELPRTSTAQLSAGTRIPASAAQPGDLVGWPGHVGIYVGDGQYVAAHSPGKPLSVRPVYNPNAVYVRLG